MRDPQPVDTDSRLVFAVAETLEGVDAPATPEDRDRVLRDAGYDSCYTVLRSCECPMRADRPIERSRRRPGRRKPLVYVAGPLHTSGWIWDNMRAALRARLELVRSGLCVVYTPHLDAYTATLELTDEAVWMRHCLDAVRLSDAVYRLPGKSRGSDEETNLADRLEIPVFRDAETLMLWLQTVGEGSDG